MKTTLQALKSMFFVVCILLLLRGAGANSPAASIQKSPQSTPQTFVRLDSQKRVFYGNEHIGFGVLRRGTQPGDVTPSSCSFGGNGSKFQVLRNGTVVRETKLGSVSKLAISKIQGMTYAGFGASTFPFDFVPERDLNLKDSYQIRHICGDEISAPSETFHVDSWLEPVDGLQVSMRPLKSEYQLGEPILVEATMRNVGTRPRLCPVPTADDGYMKPFWQFHARGNLRDSRPQWGEQELYTRKLKTLDPGDSLIATFSLSELQLIGDNGTRKFGSEAGNYVVFATVYFHDDSPQKFQRNLWRGEMTSNTVEIIVR